VQQDAFARAQYIETVLAVVFTIVKPIDRKNVAYCNSGVFEGDAVDPPIFELPFVDPIRSGPLSYTDYQ
jgi:hypothetical protein